MQSATALHLISLERVLVPTDFSDEAFKAQEDALASVHDPSCLHILHVLPYLNPGDPGVTWSTVDDRSRTEHVRQYFRERYPAPEYDQVHLSVVVGDPATEIATYAKEHNISLIVIPSHGRVGFSRFLIGSVAERVVRLSPCPVLVLRRHD
jgi:nucleotide-binding universal stress UspA family protein